jgi:uncharacterized protein (TIGR02118 family)
MVKFVVLYNQPEDPSDFDRHYAETHIPLVEKIPDLKRFEAGKVLGSPDGSPAPYYYMAELSFQDPDAMQAALGSPEGEAAAADVGTFATGGASIMVVEA